MDYFITPRTVPMGDWLQQPLAYDHAAIRVLLQAGSHTTRLSPPFDFATFTRSTVSGKRKEIPIRPVMVLDAMEPWPDADLTLNGETSIDDNAEHILDEMRRRRLIPTVRQPPL